MNAQSKLTSTVRDSTVPHMADVGKVKGIGIPALRSPVDGLRMLDTSMQFCWGATEDGFGYELQYSQDADFARSRSRVFQNLPAANAHTYIPEDKLSAGKWFWRVRTMTNDGIFGNWSPARTFTTITTRRKGVRERVISAERPLFIFHSYSEEGVADRWEQIPEHLRPYIMLRIERHRTEELIALFERPEMKAVPALIQLAGPHDSYGGNYARIPLPDVEHIFQRFPNVKGVQIVEQSCQGGVPQPRVTRYLMGMMRLASSYGKIMVWADGQWHGNNVWIDAALHEELHGTIRECGESFVPTWKMNCGWMPYAVQGPIFGLWTSDAVANWGVEPESWFWYEAGFHGLGEQHDFKEGDIEKCPLPFWGQMALMGLSAGATVYSFEPPGALWDPNGKLSESGERVVLPLLSRIVEWGLIPSRNEIREPIRVAYVASREDTPWRKDGGPLSTIYKGTYGIDHPFQLIPATGRYGWIPVLSPFTEHRELAGYDALISASSFRTPEEVRAFFDPLYPAETGGSAWTAKAGSTWVVSNHHENRDAKETFSIPLGELFSRLEGELEVNGYLVISMQGDRTVRIHANGRSDRTMSLRVCTRDPAAPRVQAAPESALSRSSYEKAGKTFTCVLNFKTGAADLVITAG